VLICKNLWISIDCTGKYDTPCIYKGQERMQEEERYGRNKERRERMKEGRNKGK
jgi:hypothetical protein